MALLPLCPDRIGIWKCWFLRRGENRSTRRKSSRSKDENQQQTQPTYDAESGNRTRATLVGGERSHHCAIPAPQLSCFLAIEYAYLTLFRPGFFGLPRLGSYATSVIWLLCSNLLLKNLKIVSFIKGKNVFIARTLFLSQNLMTKVKDIPVSSHLCR